MTKATLFHSSLAINDSLASFVEVFHVYEQQPTRELYGELLLDAIRSDSTVASFTHTDILANYEVYRTINRFLISRGINIPANVNGNHIIIVRVLKTIWPDEEHAADLDAAYNRFLASRRRNDNSSPNPLPPSPFAADTAAATGENPNTSRPQDSDLETALRESLFDTPHDTAHPPVPPLDVATITQPAPAPPLLVPSTQFVDTLDGSGSSTYRGNQFIANQTSATPPNPLSIFKRPSESPSDTTALPPAPTPTSHVVHAGSLPAASTVDLAAAATLLAPYHKALEQRTALLAEAKSPHSSDVKPSKYLSHSTDAATLSSNLQTRYKNDKSKFGGTSDENWLLALARYQRNAQELGLSTLDKVNFIRHIFKGDAEQHYYAELESIRNWNDLVSALNERYNSLAPEQAIADEIRNLSLDHFLTHGGTDKDALQRLARRIETLVPQAPNGRKNDVDKRDALYYAVRVRTWAEPPISVLSRHHQTYKQFLDALTTAEQNHRISRSLRSKPFPRSAKNLLLSHNNSPPPLPSPSSSSSSDLSVATWFIGQCRYGRDRRAKKTPSLSDRRDRRCLNCGDTSHLVSRCTKPRDDVRIMSNRIKDLLKGKSSELAVKILKELLLEQSAYINFLSENLMSALTSPAPTGLKQL